jgi:small ligand-binding sensory domain FIST
MNDTGLSGFLSAHASHPDAHLALALVAAQIDAQRAGRPGFEPTLALLYVSDRHAAQAQSLFDEIQARWPGMQVAGTVGMALAASGVEYVDEPAIVMLVLNLPRAAFRVFHGGQALLAAGEQAAWTALVHADPSAPDLAELIDELAERTGSGYLFGGLTASRSRAVQWADGVWSGGLSGVAFADSVGLVSRVTQGCQPIGPTRTVTSAERNVLISLDGRPALSCLLDDLGVGLEPPEPLLARLRATLVGITDQGDMARGRGGQFGADTRVRHLVGIDPLREVVAVGDLIEPGMQIAFCQRNVEAARRDLMRIAAEIRDELDGEGDDSVGGAQGSGEVGDLPGTADLHRRPARQIEGALYVSCNGRGGAHFGGPSAELQIVRHALGDVPLVGFFAAGEIAGHHLFGYTGVLTVWARS